jgi:hypothetical protein
MTSTTPRQSSLPKLSEAARHVVIPEGIVKSVYPRVRRRLLEVGVVFDPWQQGFSTIALGCREDGKYAATVGGVVASIPRQVGKTFTVGNLVIGLCLEFPGSRWIWTSHHNRTTTNTFRSFQGMVKRKAIAPYLAPTPNQGIRTANGEQEIEFRNGSIIMFGARAQGFGRGMDEIDGEVFDEAQILSMKALEDMVPATNQARNPHGGLLFFLGTPPRPDDDGEAFSAKRDKALKGKPVNQVVMTRGDQAYVEFSATPGTEPDDESQWPIMNPSFPHRTPIEAMQRMRENIPDDDSWDREARGIWPSNGNSVFDIVRWSSSPLLDREAVEPDRAALTIAVAPNREWACIGIAGETASKTMVLCHSMRGLAGVAAKVVEIQAARDIISVRLAGNAARALAPDLTKADVEFDVMSQTEMGAACGAFQQAYRDETVIHTGQSDLDRAIANAQTRRVGESTQWDRRDPKVDDSPLVACSAALYEWGLKYDPNYEILESIL